jgi:hypothetical protein
MKAVFASISLAVALAGGCASNARAPKEEPAYKGPNPAGKIAGGCVYVALGTLKEGPFFLPVAAGVVAVCAPLVATVAIAHEVLPAGPYVVLPARQVGPDTANFTYPDGSAAMRTGAYLNGGRDSSGGMFPSGYHQCFSGRCW